METSLRINRSPADELRNVSKSLRTLFVFPHELMLAVF